MKSIKKWTSADDKKRFSLPPQQPTQPLEEIDPDAGEEVSSY